MQQHHVFGSSTNATALSEVGLFPLNGAWETIDFLAICMRIDGGGKGLAYRPYPT